MTLPKTLSDSLVKKLNKACAMLIDVCDKDRDCGDLGWCEPCWILVGGEPKDAIISKGDVDPVAGKKQQT